MRLLLVLAWLPLAYLVLLVLSPLIGGVAHVIFLLERLQSWYAPWTADMFGVLLHVLIVGSVRFWQVLVFGLLPVVALC